MPWRSHTSSSASRLSNFSCCDRLVGEPLFLLPQEGRVVAGPRRQRPRSISTMRVASRCEERAIVGDEDDGARDSRRESLRATSMASMSRWLVGSSSSSSVRLRHQRARQQHAAPPAARQRVDGASAGRSSRVEHQLDALFDAASRPARRARAAARRACSSAPACCVVRPRGAPCGGRRRPARSARRGLRRRRRTRAVRRERHVLLEPGDATPGWRHTVPASGGSSPLRIWSSVDLPVPLRPMTAHPLARARPAATHRRAAADVRRRGRYGRA